MYLWENKTKQKNIGEGFLVTLSQFLKACDLSCFRRELLPLWHKTLGWATAGEPSSGSHLVTSPDNPGESLAIRSVHTPKDSPPAETVTIPVQRTKKLVLSQDPELTTPMWKSDLKILRLAWFLSVPFTFPKAATEPAHSALEADWVSFFGTARVLPLKFKPGSSYLPAEISIPRASTGSQP